MVSAKPLLFASVLAASVVALPYPDCNKPALSAETIIAIDGRTASCVPGGANAAECADAARAAPAISASFEKYDVTTPGEQAALISIMLFETGGFKFNKNHFSPSGGPNPGQGTRNMQNLPFNIEYATKLYGAETASTAAAAGGDAVVELLNRDDDTSFGSAAWFLTTKCSDEVREGLAAATPEGHANYLTKCVGTTATEECDVIWRAAIKELGAETT